MPTRTGLFFFSFFFSVGNSIIGMPNLEVPRFTLVLGTLPWCFGALPWFLALYLGFWDLGLIFFIRKVHYRNVH